MKKLLLVLMLFPFSAIAEEIDPAIEAIIAKAVEEAMAKVKAEAAVNKKAAFQAELANRKALVRARGIEEAEMKIRGKQMVFQEMLIRQRAVSLAIINGGRRMPSRVYHHPSGAYSWGYYDYPRYNRYYYGY